MLFPSRLNIPCDVLHFSPHPQQIAAPDLADLFLGVAAAHELERHVECFWLARRMV